MDSHTIWLIALSIATPIAGVVGFGIQLREVKKTHLENEKLRLEIDALRKKAEEAERRIVQVSTAEVQKFAAKGDILFSRSSSSKAPPISKPKVSIKERVQAAAIIFGFLLLAGYLLYDLYRIVMWVASKLS